MTAQQVSVERPNAERGSITAFVAVISFALVMVAGMVYDGGQIVAAQAEARAVASKAARAGAQEVDTGSIRATGRPTLHPARARTAAQRYLDEAGVPGTVTVSGDTVRVTVRITQEMRILPMPDRVVTATDAATAVTDPEGGWT